MENQNYRLFVAFAAEDRYTVAEPIVYHLKNYGVHTWYDRHNLLLGDKRRQKNLEEGAKECSYACIIISENTKFSVCAMEEIEIIKKRYFEGDVTVFPVFYEISPASIPLSLSWTKDLIYKEVNKRSGTREVCNHISCRISENMLMPHHIRNIRDCISWLPSYVPSIRDILCSYIKADHANVNSKISLLYAAYLVMRNTITFPNSAEVDFACHVFNRLFAETQLNISVDYREIWLLENSMCILANCLLTCGIQYLNDNP